MFEDQTVIWFAPTYIVHNKHCSSTD